VGVDFTALEGCSVWLQKQVPNHLLDDTLDKFSFLVSIQRH